MYLFVCSTPFQIMNAINIAFNLLKDQKIDLYILDHSPECYTYFCILKKKYIFNAVYFLKTRDIYTCSKKNKLVNYIGYIKKAYNALNYRILENKICNKNLNYDFIFIAYPDLPAQIIYYYFKKKNPAIKLSFFEDGIYTYNALNKNYNWLRIIYSKIIFGSFILNDVENMYIYKPGMVNIRNKNVKKYQIPEINKIDPQIKNIINESMGFDEKYLTYLEDNSCIFFDQPFGFDDLMKQQINLLKVISNTIGSNNTSVKIHPRMQKKVQYESICNVIKLQLPFEVLELNYDINNKILISISSTACLNPKIIFNEEPFVFMLYKLVDLKNLDTDFFDIVLKVKSSYKDGGRFFIPKTFEEFLIALQNISNYPTLEA